MTEETWQAAVHAAAALRNKASLLSLWQWLAKNQHDWNAPNAAAQVMSAHALAAFKPKQGTTSFFGRLPQAVSRTQVCMNGK